MLNCVPLRLVLLAAAVASASCGCAGVRLHLAPEGIDFGEPVDNAAGALVAVVLFDDIRPNPGELGSVTSFLPPPVNTYRTAWVWGTLKFFTDEPLTRQFTNAVAQGLTSLGFFVFRSPEPTQWTEDAIREINQRTGAQRLVRGVIRDFSIHSDWTLMDPCKMKIVLEVRVFDRDGKVLCARTVERSSTRRLLPGEAGFLMAQQQAALTFQEWVEELFRDEEFRRALEVEP